MYVFTDKYKTKHDNLPYPYLKKQQRKQRKNVKCIFDGRNWPISKRKKSQKLS